MDLLHVTIPVCAAAFLFWTVSARAEEAPPTTEHLDYQERLLLQPTSAQLAAEEQGKIHIYDSLEMSMVNQALDRHFNRIDSMMFVRIHHLPPAGAGSAKVEDDGCD
jgi:hypothetical protein